MLRDFSIENQPDWRSFGKRYLTIGDFIRLCNLVGLHSCNEHELENYEARRVMYPAARTIMPEEYARAFWISQHQQSPIFEFDDAYLPFHELDWALRYQIPRPNNQGIDFRHPIDKSWGIEGLVKPIEQEFGTWDNYSIAIQVGNRRIRKSTATHFYHYWQIYELYSVRKFHEGMYRGDSNWLRPFGNPSHSVQGELPYYFEALSFFHHLFSSHYSSFLENLQPNNDGFVILDQGQQNDLQQVAHTFANNTIGLYNLDQNALIQGLRKMMELHVIYEEAERYKLSLALRKDIWHITELISYAFGMSAEDIAVNTGPVGGFIGNYLELLFPNRRKKVKEEATRLLEHLLQEHRRNSPNYSLSDRELADLLNYMEATNIAWIEYVIVELNKAFFELHSWHATVTFLYLKLLASLPETLMKTLVQNNSDQQTQQDFNAQRNPGMGTLINLLFRNLSPAILTHYQRTNHWEARDSAQFAANLVYLSNAITSSASEDEYLGIDLALATLVRNFSSHLVVDDPALLQGQYVLCVRSILASVSAVWIAARGKNWV
jgi:hypothetical protein